MMESFKILNFNDEEILNIFKIVSGVLNCTQVEIQGDEHSSHCKEDKYFNSVLDLLGISKDQM